MRVHHARLPLVNPAQVEKYDHDKYKTEGHYQIPMQTVLIDELSAIMYLWSLESLPVALLFDCGLRCDIPYFLKSPVCSVLFEKLFKSRNWSDCPCIMYRHIESDI